MTRLYLDHNATTPLCPEALEAMLPLLSGEGGNPSSIHAAGRDARAALDEARDRLAALLGARPGELIFTGGGTEADNLALIGLARRRVRSGVACHHVIVSQVEHHAVLNAADFLEREAGFTVTRLPVDGCGRIRPAELRAAITPDTAAVSLMAANNETGTVQPLAEFAAICREAGVPFHTDLVQGFGKLPVRVDAEGAPDALSIAAHKFYGPKGVGALWLRTGVALEPVSFGGAQENGRRPGTENVAAIAGMAAAAEAAVRGMAAETARLAPLRDRLWEGIAALYPAAVRNGAWQEAGGQCAQLANTLNVSFPGLDGETLLIRCDLEGLCVSGGSACMAGAPQPSHVLLAMGVPEAVARASLRFSLGRSTTAETVSAALERLARVLK